MQKERQPGANALALKIFAIVVMTANHLGGALEGIAPAALTNALIGVGGATYIVMSFLLAEGYRHTRSVSRYALRLLAFACLAQPFYSLHPERMSNFNVLFTLFFALLSIHATVKAKRPAACLALTALLVILSGFCDWGYIGVLIALAFFWIPDRKTAAAVAVGITVADMGGPALRYVIQGYSQYWPTVFYTFVGCVSGGLAVCLYNGRRGGSERRGFLRRYFFYLYYGVHLALIDGFMCLLFKTPLEFAAPYPLPPALAARATEWLSGLLSRLK